LTHPEDSEQTIADVWKSTKMTSLGTAGYSRTSATLAGYSKLTVNPYLTIYEDPADCRYKTVALQNIVDNFKNMP